MKNEILDELVSKGSIEEYQKDNLDEEDKVGRSLSYNSERLILVFPSGEELILTTWCDASTKSSGFFIED